MEDIRIVIESDVVPVTVIEPDVDGFVTAGVSEHTPSDEQISVRHTPSDPHDPSVEQSEVSAVQNELSVEQSEASALQPPDVSPLQDDVSRLPVAASSSPSGSPV